MSKIREITRKKSWPTWANWAATDEDLAIYVFESEPAITKLMYGAMYWWPLSGSTHMRHVGTAGPCAHWRASLRRIVAGKRGKGKK